MMRTDSSTPMGRSAIIQNAYPEKFTDESPAKEVLPTWQLCLLLPLIALIGLGRHICQEGLAYAAVFLFLAGFTAIFFGFPALILAGTIGLISLIVG